VIKENFERSQAKNIRDQRKRVEEFMELMQNDFQTCCVSSYLYIATFKHQNRGVGIENTRFL